tara:strand:- start:1943 stop:3076 length:1134 start_codon:yes stop_codon:yes gene_type:complete
MRIQFFLNFIRRFLLIILGALSFPVFSDSLVLSSFDDGILKVVQPNQTNPSSRYLWNQYEGDPTEGPDPGSEIVTNETSFSGGYSLKVTIDSGNAYTQFYPNNGSTWGNSRDYIDSGSWEFNKYNRLRFWVKLPPGVVKKGNGQANAHFGTYFRSSTGDTKSPESGGQHYYHYLNLESTGEWHQIIIDTHPSHARGANGGVEQGNREYPTGESNYNYFDAMTRFYFDLLGSLSSYPSSIFYDNFEYYEEKNPENIDQIYNLNGVYVPSENKISIGWMRDKNENSVKHEVKYSYSDIFIAGWDNASVAPNGVVTPPGWQGYNGMNWSTTDINVEGKSAIFIAIKPQNSSLFRQIRIPISGTAAQSLAQPPASFRAIIR